MKWMEIVRVRSVPEKGEDVLAVLEEQVRLCRASAPGSEIMDVFVVKHGVYSGDMAAVFMHGGISTPRKSREGYALADAMHRFGSVEHVVWTVVSEPVNSCV